MPLIDCPDCTHPVSDRASFCPTCGCPSQYFPRFEPQRPQASPKTLEPNLEPFELLGRVVLGLTACVIGVDLTGLALDDVALRYRGVGIAGVVQVLSFTLLHHRWWAALPEDARRTTPSRAVMGTLVPGFNLLWLRTAWFGLVDDLNHFLTAKGTADFSAPTFATQAFVPLYYLLAPTIAALPMVGVELPYWAHIGADLAAFLSLFGFIKGANRAASYALAHKIRGE